MNCRKVSQLLSAYMDAELQGVEHRQIRDHLNRCFECREEYEELLQMKRMLGSLRTKEPRPVVQERILYHIAWEEQQRESKLPSSWFDIAMARGRQAAASTHLGVIGAGIATIVIAFAVHGYSPTTGGSPGNAITWEPAQSSVSQYVEGLQPSDSSHFASRPLPAAFRQDGRTQDIDASNQLSSFVKQGSVRQDNLRFSPGIPLYRTFR